MYIFAGGTALTLFRQQQLLSRLKTIFPEIQDISAQFFYFVHSDSSVDDSTLKCLQLLLLAQPTVLADEVLMAFVVPRFGTISPWSSKATDIAKICGFDGIVRIERGIRYQAGGVHSQELSKLCQQLYDPMTESVVLKVSELAAIFKSCKAQPLAVIDVLSKGLQALSQANQQLGLSLSFTELKYLSNVFQTIDRNPTDAELMMFAQVNSEHCRHKIFNAAWTIDGLAKKNTLFSMIRNTYSQHSDYALVAYSDNAAVLRGSTARRLLIDPETRVYRYRDEVAPIVFKVETHNHPTAISPFPGAATGSGGEIRDEAATGRGARTKMGLVGFSVSHLRIPGFPQPWEDDDGKSGHIASALDIMLQGPIGAASFNNEFGRPNLYGYFRTFGMLVEMDYGKTYRGYDKPIMIAGGVGTIRDSAVDKKMLPVGALLLVLGGPAMAIGLGGGAASSRATSDSHEALDFASVQRSNPEMQRRCQEVIDSCWMMGNDNPILSIHDVGAGGLSNALPELVQACELGAIIQLRDIPNAAPGMTPMEIWCNEAQERYVLSINAADLDGFKAIAERERCPFAVVGEVTKEAVLIVEDQHFNNRAVNLPMPVLFENLPQLQCQAERAGEIKQSFDSSTVDLAAAIKPVLQFPCVASKSFLITIGDRTVTGLVTRDQMIGPWQVPVSDVAVTCVDYWGDAGEALAMGERAPIALLHHAASARMAVGEAITNIAAACISDIQHIALSANWMAAVNFIGDAVGLYEAVQAIGLELCPALGISIPVGKDSLSMRTEWEEDGVMQAVTAPLSLVISAAATVEDVGRTLTPELCREEDSFLLLIDLGEGACALGGSVLAQIHGVLGECPPDVDNPAALKSFFSLIQALNKQGLLLAYHDRSDGGLLVTVVEMMFAGHVGVDLCLDGLDDEAVAALFTEELGAVVQVRGRDLGTVEAIIAEHGLSSLLHRIGRLNAQDILSISFNGRTLYSERRVVLQQWWAETSYRLQALRDHPDCAQQEFERIADADDLGLNVTLSFDVKEDIATPYLSIGVRPKIGILREQGVNGHVEMAAAFDRVGFTSVDVHMSELLAGQVDLKDFVGIVACGGFSYGDVLGAGRGWAQSVLQHSKVYDSFFKFFNRPDTFALGVCNGCQMFSHLQAIIPGADHWPTFERNRSEQFEARLLLVAVEDSPSLFFNNMAGSVIPVPVAHGEGYVQFENNNIPENANVALRYVDHHHQVTEHYPENPNGSIGGVTGFTTSDGRVTIMMPHPERVVRTVQLSWHPQEWGEHSPWYRFFANARLFVS